MPGRRLPGANHWAYNPAGSEFVYLKENTVKQSTHVDKESVFRTPDGMQRRVLAYGGKLMMIHVAFDAGVTTAAHSHPHEQIGYVVSGTIDFVIEGQGALHMTAGGSYYVAPNVKHNVVTHTPAVLVEIFSPIREDFLS